MAEYRPWQEWEVEYLRQNYLTKPKEVVAAKLNRSEYSVKNKAGAEGIRKPCEGRRIAALTRKKKQKVDPWEITLRKIDSVANLQNEHAEVKLFLQVVKKFRKKFPDSLNSVIDRLSQQHRLADYARQAELG